MTSRLLSLFHNVFLHPKPCPACSSRCAISICWSGGINLGPTKTFTGQSRGRSAAPGEIYSLIEEGKEVSHDNQSGFGEGQQDFPDVQSSLLQAVHC